MNRVFISGKIKTINYKFVDKGKIYAIAFVKLLLDNQKGEIWLVFKNNFADVIYSKYEINDYVITEGEIRNLKKGSVIIAKSIYKFQTNK